MPHMIVVSAVKKYAKERNKRVGKSFIDYLDRKVYALLELNASAQRKTLNAADAEALESLKR